MKIKNITFKDYIELEDKSEYDYYIQYAVQFNIAYDVFDIGDFTQLSFGLIKDIQYDFNKGVDWMQFINYLGQATGRELKELSKTELISISQCKNYFVEEIDRINLIEKNGLSGIITEEERSAGIDKFDSFGSYFQLRALSGNDITKHDQINNLKYIDCFVELMAIKTLSDYQENLFNIRMKNK